MPVHHLRLSFRSVRNICVLRFNSWTRLCVVPRSTGALKSCCYRRFLSVWGFDMMRSWCTHNDLVLFLLVLMLQAIDCFTSTLSPKSLRHFLESLLPHILKSATLPITTVANSSSEKSAESSSTNESISSSGICQSNKLASRCVVALAKRDMAFVMNELVSAVLPSLVRFACSVFCMSIHVRDFNGTVSILCLLLFTNESTCGYCSMSVDKIRLHHSVVTLPKRNC